MVHFGFRNFCFWNRFVSEMLGAAYGLSRELCVGFLVVLIKSGLSRLSPDSFRAKHGRIYGRELLMCVITVN